jgi:hypothetical protein
MMNILHYLLCIARYDCKNLIGSFVCVCPSGYRVIDNGDDCEDIDECNPNDDDDDVCGGGGKCINLKGGYECECPDGFDVSPDGTKCMDMREDRGVFDQI